MIHKPVLLKEVTENLNLKKGMTVVDATLGGGGYSKAILKKIYKTSSLEPLTLELLHQRSSRLQHTVLYTECFHSSHNVFLNKCIHN